MEIQDMANIQDTRIQQQEEVHIFKKATSVNLG
jgi:hypothetical protein